MTQAAVLSGSDLRETFARIVGADNVREDEASRKLFSEDVWSRSDNTVVLIVAPATTEELAEIVRAAGTAGVSLAPRGAGMSYTGSFLPANDHTVAIDTTRMNKVLAISPEDMTVTVQAGCSWLELNEALKPHGLRTPFWGPMSGIYSTIGGGLSQLNAMFGAGHHGTTSESMIAVTMVLADGRILRTGARLLLLDEVLAGLNPQEIAEMIPVVQGIAQSGVTVLMIEHVMQAVMSLAQEVWVLAQGQLIAQGTPAEVTNNKAVVEAYLGQGTAERLQKTAARVQVAPEVQP